MTKQALLFGDPLASLQKNSKGNPDLAEYLAGIQDGTGQAEVVSLVRERAAGGGDNP